MSMYYQRSWPVAPLSFCTILVIGFVTCCWAVAGENQEQLQEVWRKKVQVETKQFSDWFKSHITGYSTEVAGNLILNNKPLRIHRRQLIKRNGTFYLDSSEEIETNPTIPKDPTMIPSVCYGINSKYAFQLNKSKKGEHWIVTKVINMTPDFDEKQLWNVEIDGVTGFRNYIDHLFGAGGTVRLIDRSIGPWEFGDLPGFRMKSISTDGPRQNILHVNFDYEVADAERKQTDVANCELDFDLEAKCYPVKSHQVLKNGKGETILDWTQALTQTKESEYELKTFSRLKNTSNSAIMQFEETKAETVLLLDSLPESDFTLSAFGLPEPPGIEWNKPFPWYLVFAGIGTACLGVFFFLRSRAKRL